LRTKMRRFRSSFGVGPRALAICFHDLQCGTVEDLRVKKPQLDYFLIAACWLSKYPTEEVMAGQFGQDEKTLREHARVYVHDIAKLIQAKICWDDGDCEAYLLSVDGVHFMIREPRRDPSTKWLSYKHKCAGLVYEIGLSVYENRIVWINGPFKASVHDKTVFDDHGLGAKIPDGKLAVTDRGYRGSDYIEKLAIRNVFDGPAVRAFKRRVRARHENLNKRFKCFDILKSVFRHDHTDHGTVMRAVAVLVQYDLENGHPLMDMYFDDEESIDLEWMKHGNGEDQNYDDDESFWDEDDSEDSDVRQGAQSDGDEEGSGDSDFGQGAENDGVSVDSLMSTDSML